MFLLTNFAIRQTLVKSLRFESSRTTITIFNKNYFSVWQITEPFLQIMVLNKYDIH